MNKNKIIKILIPVVFLIGIILAVKISGLFSIKSAKEPISIEIAYESRSNITGTGITAQFFITDPPQGITSYEWDLGDGKQSSNERPGREYTEPKIYTISLTAHDDLGHVYVSNHINIDISNLASEAKHTDERFITLSSPDEYFVVNGIIKNILRYENINDVLEIIESDTWLTKVQFKLTGYFGLTVMEGNGREQFYSVFVSPIQSVHVDHGRLDIDWYRTQFGTGTDSNCGPASAAMAIRWGKGIDFKVEDVRRATGYFGTGAVSFEELVRVIMDNGVEVNIKPINSPQDIKDEIDSGSIVSVIFLTSEISFNRNYETDHFGVYYVDDVGHYLTIKGYSADGNYFIVYDALPSDWRGNNFRYPDGISMIGKNRYFLIDELMNSISRRRPAMIVSSGME